MGEERKSFALGAQRIVEVIAGFLFAAALFACGSAVAQHPAQSRANDEPQGNAADAALAMLAEGGQMGAAPGASDAEHASLAKLAGEWDRIVKFVGQTGANAAPSSGTCTFSVELGGRFVVEKSHDVVFGRPVDGLRIYGYNDATKQYEMARMYTMSNGITLMKGASSDGGNTIEFSGETGSGARTMPLRAHFRQTDADHFSVTMSTNGPDGKDAPFQETDYTRKK